MRDSHSSWAARTVAFFVGLVVALVLGGGVAVARSAPSLSTTSGTTSVKGADATAVFAIGNRTIRQVRYADQGTLRYTFEVQNSGPFAVTIKGLGDRQPRARLFHYRDLQGTDGERNVKIGAGHSAMLTLYIRMSGCETLSARAGSFAKSVVVRAQQAGMFTDEVTLTLPEEVHTGSPREAFCPNASATSRPRG